MMSRYHLLLIPILSSNPMAIADLLILRILIEKKGILLVAVDVDEGSWKLRQFN